MENTKILPIFTHRPWSFQCGTSLKCLGERSGAVARVSGVACAAFRPLSEIGDACYHAGIAIIYMPIVLSRAVFLVEQDISLSPYSLIKTVAWHVFRALVHLSKGLLTTITLPFALLAPCTAAAAYARVDAICSRLLHLQTTSQPIQQDVVAPPVQPRKSSLWERTIAWWRDKSECYPEVTTAIQIYAFVALAVTIGLSVKAIWGSPPIPKPAKKLIHYSSYLDDKVPKEPALPFSQHQNVLKVMRKHEGKKDWKAVFVEELQPICPLPSRTEKIITLATTYLKGNPDRDELSQLVVDNHANYTKTWNVTQLVETNSLVRDQCTIRSVIGHQENGKQIIENVKTDCEPHFNKIAVILRWLRSPRTTEPKEEWLMMLDDDMPITNSSINPYRLIDAVREGKNTSVVIAKDLNHYHQGDSTFSVNTGFMAVRKDEVSLAVFEDIWRQRDRRSNARAGYYRDICPTLGVCKEQADFHEQRAFANLLFETPQFLWSQFISVIDPRERSPNSMRSDIAINTYSREDCYQRPTISGFYQIDFSTDPKDWRFAPGDFATQCTLPTIGRKCESTEVQPLRLMCIKDLLAQAV